MTITIADAWQAGVDAVAADQGLSRGLFVDAMQTVITDGFNNAEGNAYVDAVVAEFHRLGLINANQWGSPNGLRRAIFDDPAAHSSLYNALAVSVNALPEALPVLEAVNLTNFRDDRDNVNDALDRLDALIAAEPNGTVGRLVKEVMREGKQQLRTYKEQLRDAIRNITGNPDS